MDSKTGNFQNSFRKKEKKKRLTPWVKICGFLVSSISSSFSLVVALPAKTQKKGFQLKNVSLEHHQLIHQSLTNFQLPLDPSFASFPVICLCLIVVRHDLDELPG
jgi:hypothetical protein